MAAAISARIVGSYDSTKSAVALHADEEQNRNVKETQEMEHVRTVREGVGAFGCTRRASLRMVVPRVGIEGRAVGRCERQEW